MAARRRVLFGILCVSSVAALAGHAVLSAFVRSALYPVPPVPVPSPPPAPFEELALESGSGALSALSAWWLPPRNPGSPVVLMLHGNGENLETLRWSGLFDRFDRLGVAVLALDYPGYGRSEGTPSEKAIETATRAAWSEVVKRAGEERPRIVAGWSLGAAAAASLAAVEPATVDGLLLLSPWTRLAEVAALHFPAWLVHPVLTDRYDSLEAASAIRCPTLVVHGADDQLIPAELGRRLFEALPGPKRWVAVDGAGHNDLLGRQEAWEAIATELEAARRR